VFRSCSYDPLWPVAETNRWKRRLKRELDQCHPWGAAALALSKGQRKAAEQLLEEWKKEGIKARELDEIAAAPNDLFRSLNQSLEDLDKCRLLPEEFRLLSLGIELNDWQLHAWLNKLGLRQSTRIEAHQTDHPETRQWPLIAVQLEAVAPYTAGPEQAYLLTELSHAHSVFDTDPSRVDLLRRLGINAKVIPTTFRAANEDGWLATSYAATAASRLGLPESKQLDTLGSIICLGRSQENGWTNLIRPPLMAIPGFDAIETHTWQEARGLAAWIASLLDSELSVVRINPTDHEIRKRGFACLEKAVGRKIHSFIDPIHPEELVKEIQWRQAGCVDPVLPQTPKPTHRILWSHIADKSDSAATICISLYNYAHTVTRALDSVKQQQNTLLDLIVVDDGSTDSGAAETQRWLDTNKNYFRRTTLIQHIENGGLASARNTAFTHAETEWCFVLDADNALYPEALDQCLKLTRSDLKGLAVVHPLIEVVNDENGAQIETLMSEHSWQLNRLIRANHVDAMALIRRSAWEHVGGYQHLPYGWEDYDFWCNLISHGYFGIVCPQIVATYYEHQTSMLRIHTQRSIRETSRILQKRHPWLQLSTSTGLREGGLE
jgi:GT2 family glycosyltransferase